MSCCWVPCCGPRFGGSCTALDTALTVAVSKGLGMRSLPPLGTMTRMLLRMQRSCTTKIGTKGILTPWAMKPTPICAVYWITCRKLNG